MAIADVDITAGDLPDRDELVALYDAVGWSAYTKDPDILVAAVRGSARVVTARHHGELLGLARVITDGATICYVQDILVRPELQREGLGRMLIRTVLEPYEQVRQTVLVTDDEPGQRAFYESLGFREIRDLADGGLRAFVRLR